MRFFILSFSSWETSSLKAVCIQLSTCCLPHSRFCLLQLQPTAMADSDSDEPTTQKRPKLPSAATSGGSETAPSARPQVARKLRKEKRQQKLLQTLDKKAYLSSQKGVIQELEDSSSSKKGKRKNGEKAMTTAEDDSTPTVAENVKQQGRKYTVSIAVAGSILDNAQTPQLKAYLAGQVARAAGVFNVDEVVVYDDTGGAATQACELMARNLQYLETPPYLRKHLYQIHPDLQYSGLIAPLDIPHHLRKNEALPYREGVVEHKPLKEGKDVSYVFVGLDRDCRVDKRLPEGVRVTVKFEDPSSHYILKPKGKLKGSVVSPSLPRVEAGLYWGYTVRIASSFSKVFTQCPYKDGDGYDLTIGTSEKGYPVKDFKVKQNSGVKHVLIVFGGVEGLEYALENDETLMEDNVSVLFDHYINTCPNQGSRTIRTEEAILISMTTLAPILRNSLSKS